MNNRELYQNIKEKAFNSVYWSRKQKLYFDNDIYNYAPMVNDELFNILFKHDAIVSVNLMENKLHRKIKIEELKVCPLSARYFLFDTPIITESIAEYRKLIEFDLLITDRINRYEVRTRNYLKI